MFWVALATAIMLASGDGDDTRAIRDFLAALREQIPLHIKDAVRAKEAARGVDILQAAFEGHRKRLDEYSQCVQKADNNYSATDADYRRCEEGLDKQVSRLAEQMQEASSLFKANIKPAEYEKIDKNLMQTENGKEVEQAAAEAAERLKNPPPPPRSRALEGAETERHITLPRNVVSLLFGPLHPQTFGQRYSNHTVEAGTSYQRRNWAGGDGSNDLNQYFARFGVAFGLFDDIEAGALFVPLELSPDFRWDQVMVFLTQQFRHRNFDVALRFSFQTPGDVGWSLSPGAFLRFPVGITRLDVGLQVPMDVGMFRDPAPFVIGLNLPVRETFQFTSQWFMTVESGFVRSSFAAGENSSIPLGVGTGYTILAGKRLFDITGLFQWDDFLLSAARGADVFQPGSYRAVLGVSTQMQAM